LVHTKLTQVSDSLRSSVQEDMSHRAARHANDDGFRLRSSNEDARIVPGHVASEREPRLAAERDPHSPRHRLTLDQSSDAFVVSPPGKCDRDAHEAVDWRCTSVPCSAFRSGAAYDSSPSGKPFRCITSERNRRLMEKKWLHMNQFRLLT